MAILLLLHPTTKPKPSKRVRMKAHFLPLAAMLVVALAAISCSSEETYEDKKNRERDAINAYIAQNAIKVISQGQFEAQDSTTNLSDNEYVYLDDSGVYMQIERKGCGNPIEDNGKRVNVLCRYIEYNIQNAAVQTYNDGSGSSYTFEPDVMTVVRSLATYSAQFTSGTMYSEYGSTVPMGWLVPLPYIKVGRQTEAGEEIAKVKVIVPHSQGHTYAQANVYPCAYTITYQRER